MPEPKDVPSLETIQALVVEQGQTFEAFKVANDNRVAEIEKKGSADPVTVDKVDKANEALGVIAVQIDEIIAAKKANDEATAATLEVLQDAFKKETERNDRLETAFKRSPTGSNDNGEGEILYLKSVAGFFTDRAQASSAKARPVRVEDLNEEMLGEFKAYEAAFATYMRTSPDQFGQGLGVDVAKALSVGIEADGGFWVTPIISNRIMTRLFETSPIRSIATVVTIGSDAIEFPIDSNSGTSGGWVGEQGARAETATPGTGVGRISVHEQFANPRATQKLLDDAQFPVEQWLGNKIADILARTENTAFVTGIGTDRPRGFMDYADAAVTTADATRAWGVLQETHTVNASGFAADPNGPDSLIDMIHSLNPAYRARAKWVMNRATVGTIRKMQDSNGMYVWQMGNIQVGQPSSLLGYGLTEAEDMADIAANAYPVAFGDFSEGYLIVDRQGIRTLRDPFSAKPYVQFYTTKRVGGDVTNFDAIKLLQVATP